MSYPTPCRPTIGSAKGPPHDVAAASSNHHFLAAAFNPFALQVNGAVTFESTLRELTTVGASLMSCSALNECIAVNDCEWARFAAHWDQLSPDRYAAELGTQRLRRYGHFAYSSADGAIRLLLHESFVQPEDSNPLYIGLDRCFEPLTDSFATDPLLHAMLALVGCFATALDDAADWSAKVTPFRVVASAAADGHPTPEGLHRDGVTLVTSLLIGRHNATGGQSTVVDMTGQTLLTTTLCEPGTLLLGDDRKTLHGVSPIRPVDPTNTARRDVLVITFAARSAQ